MIPNCIETVLESKAIGMFSAFVRGGGHKTEWACYLGCGHYRKVGKAGRPPKRLLCRVCKFPQDRHYIQHSEEARELFKEKADILSQEAGA